MSTKDVRTHTMLDLEIAAHPLKHNPAIIQTGAIHFHIETGKVLKTFSIDINLESCIESGLITDSDTLQWLEKNIPGTRPNRPPTDLRKPWMHYNDFCVRTYCEAAFSITGRNIRREVDKSFVGKNHNAIDDCKHQILYLTKCRDAFRGLQGSAITPVPAGPIFESSVKRPRTVLDDNRSRMGLD
ncbi:uncharacterized protein Bfra_008750 [Botrytis fragariae]|uniref:3'-5' exoribonuclease Rv2179c-like domain-containing protein n=1 Tax=Botrytis fragariae TaxID=1964551 RepID=A0A8H6EGX1_9HELO|nr:uncharacterized protein Bfra_008750 [Botrytis fragariae]KAF5871726.1 hypothetical protein Bfra_008750 [Botrytis fragariae]